MQSETNTTKTQNPYKKMKQNKYVEIKQQETGNTKEKNKIPIVGCKTSSNGIKKNMSQKERRHIRQIQREAGNQPPNHSGFSKFNTRCTAVD